MNRSAIYRLTFALLAWAIGVAAVHADIVSNTQVYTDPAGGLFYVDGQLFAGSATFLWPQGSKHTLDIDPMQQDPILKIRRAFTGWTDSTGILAGSASHLVITADPSITFYKAAMTLQYAVSLNFFTCPMADPRLCSSPGTVFVNNTPYLVNTDVYLDAGAKVTLMAVPNAGYVFAGWLQSSGNSSQAYLTSFTLNNPVVVYPQFRLAGVVTLASDPPGLQILADRARIFTPSTLEWGVGTTHTVGAVTPQFDKWGKIWVFDSWSDGGGATHAYTMQSQNSVTLTAKYVPGGVVAFLTNPPGLKLMIDGRDNWPGYIFTWAAGVKHTISALTQVDGSGRGWAFKSWSNGGPATQTFILSTAGAASGMRLTANFAPTTETTSTTVIQSSPSGITVQVDGLGCLTPCTLQRTIGSKIYVSAPSSVALSADTREQFTGWADGVVGDRTITAGPISQTFTANYQTSYRLVHTVYPDGAVIWHLAPDSADWFYPAQTQVRVSVDVAAGYRFDGWQGDASGTSPIITITMDGPRNIQAKVTRLGSSGIDAILNAVGETPETAVAPGSIISIYGRKFASSIATGPDSPLAQTLAGVAVSVGDRLLPLLFVSPGQINAQLPSDIAEGVQTLTVHSAGQTDISSTFTAQRNAPGLFFHTIAGKPYLIVLHHDGSLVSPKNPAHRGELVTALGTGFGPYQVEPLEGFAVPNSDRYKLIDRAELVFGDKIIQPEYAGAAPGRVGVTAIRFHIADPLPRAATIEIRARVNGHDSNAALLPLE